MDIALPAALKRCFKENLDEANSSLSVNEYRARAVGSCEKQKNVTVLQPSVLQYLTVNQSAQRLLSAVCALNLDTEGVIQAFLQTD